jgi:hypothetical protein
MKIKTKLHLWLRWENVKFAKKIREGGLLEKSGPCRLAELKAPFEKSKFQLQ